MIYQWFKVQKLLICGAINTIFMEKSQYFLVLYLDFKAKCEIFWNYLLS